MHPVMALSVLMTPVGNGKIIILSLCERVLLFKNGGKRDRRINLFKKKIFSFSNFRKIFLVLERVVHFNRDSLVVVAVTLVCGATLVSLSASLFSPIFSESLTKLFRISRNLNSSIRSKERKFFFRAKSCKLIVINSRSSSFRNAIGKRKKKKKRKKTLRKHYHGFGINEKRGEPDKSLSLSDNRKLYISTRNILFAFVKLVAALSASIQYLHIRYLYFFSRLFECL